MYEVFSGKLHRRLAFLLLNIILMADRFILGRTKLKTKMKTKKISKRRKEKTQENNEL